MMPIVEYYQWEERFPLFTHCYSAKAEVAANTE